MLHRILGLLIILASLAGAWLMMEFKQFISTPLAIPEGGVFYTLQPGSTVATLAGDLKAQGFLEKPLYLRLLARWDGTAQQIKAGEYHLNPGLRPRELLQVLISGKVVSHSLTLIEGWTFSQMLEAVRGHAALDHTLGDMAADEIMKELGYENQHPEGRFLPDTYHFPRGTKDRAFLKRAYSAMQRLLDEEWPKRDEGLPLNTPYEALILASIVEKETGLASERPEIAGVFTRRLHKGMKLQTDPTVIYAMGDDFDGNIRRKDLKRNSPYNTYVYKGLPPTPIAMPGADAVRAVLHPKQGNSLYFVAKGDGSHQFSATLKDHNRAVRKYQLKK